MDITFFIWLAAFAALCVGASAYVRRSFYITDLPSHFALQGAVGGFILMPVAAAMGVSAGIFPLLLLAVSLCAVRLGRVFLARPRAPSSVPGIRILQANLFKRNRETGGFAQLIARETPDIIVACEVNAQFEAFFKSLAADYPHQHIQMCGHSGYGIAVLSKIPLRDIEEKYFIPRNVPAVFFTVDIGGSDVRCATLHPSNPTYAFAARDAELESLAAWHEAEKPVRFILAGDLNATPYCAALRGLVARMGLAGGRDGRGMLGSFPTGTRTGLLRLPIDHVLVSRDTLAVADFRLGDEIGSDHLPTLSTITLARD